MMILIITTSIKGHFLNYFEIIKSQSIHSVTLLNIENISFMRRIFKIILHVLRNLKKIDEIIILNGDRDILLSLTLKFLFPSIKIKSIIYYSVQNNKDTFFNSIKSFLICISSRIGVKTFLLEYAVENIKCIFNKKNMKKLYDPILITSDLKEIQKKEGEREYLIAGYIDDRKCVKEIIEALIYLSKSDKLVKRTLNILGEQSDKVNQYIKKMNFSEDNLTIKINNNRFTDVELYNKICESDVILAIYKEHYGSSGMIINALYLNKKVLFLPIGVLKGYEEELNIVNLPNNYDIKSIVYSIQDIENKAIQYDLKKRKLFLDKRSGSNFAKSLLEF